MLPTKRALPRQFLAGRGLRQVMKTGTDGYPKTHRITPQNPKLRAQRKPMLLFVFDGLLFKFIVNTPALELLFQLPPRRKPRTALLP